MTPTTKVKVDNFSCIVKRSYNKVVIDSNFGKHEDLSTLISNIHVGLAALCEYYFSGG